MYAVPPADDQLTQALRLLPRAPHGRAAVTRHALPYIVPAWHRVADDGRTVLLRIAAGALEGGRLIDGTVVAYETNSRDAGESLHPWGVQVIGTARALVPSPGERSAFPPHPAAPHYLRLTPTLATVRH
ncbi:MULTISPECIES: pyridoxamine 5'-phosphate oxidase family protein [unclassified Streptomyces]|uniref:pyridoxamine 5'-phosphate oxidase family protein n=1 Tax=unclassified Streptomyces TaxID=2593676 RepID=UPI001903A523|nr:MULTISPECIES: pyridoxamine 5'-phosphate oxidase family protein [unclassified Streptomyces]MCU4747774.1 pyridoxamine 5'-phosphate oxidase family protein [Streptomyces sp. G-5]QQN78399.1 pyridoxamine 5'-phosphate oxidase family protein [Streptomyces sp. XC 2026]